MGFGKKYIDECIMCAEMISAYDKRRPKALLTSSTDYNYAIKNKIFDDVVVIDFDEEKYLKNETNSHNLYCVIPRVLMPKYMPYDKVLAIDSDIACISDPERLWKYLNDRDQCFDCCGLNYEDNWHWGKVGAIVENLGKKIPSIHGGVLFFNKTKETFNQYYSDCIDVLKNYTNYRCLNNFRGGMTDEVIFSIAMAKQDLLPMDYVDYPVVSFNLPPSIEMPYYYHTRDGFRRETYKQCKEPIIFNHIFFHEGNNITMYNWFLDFHKKITSIND